MPALIPLLAKSCLPRTITFLFTALNRRKSHFLILPLRMKLKDKARFLLFLVLTLKLLKNAKTNRKDLSSLFSNTKTMAHVYTFIQLINGYIAYLTLASQYSIFKCINNPKKPINTQLNICFTAIRGSCQKSLSSRF